MSMKNKNIYQVYTEGHSELARTMPIVGQNDSEGGFAKLVRTVCEGDIFLAIST
jgi:hypothetical protein